MAPICLSCDMVALMICRYALRAGLLVRYARRSGVRLSRAGEARASPIRMPGLRPRCVGVSSPSAPPTRRSGERDDKCLRSPMARDDVLGAFQDDAPRVQDR